MTAEILRHHLFGGPQVPFWNYDPAQLSIGIEVEYFIGDIQSGGHFKLATKVDFLNVIEVLKRDHGYMDHGLHDQPGRVSKDTEAGFIAIKPDFAWHILEISFPPRKSSQGLRNIMTKVFSEVDDALDKVGLERLDISALPSSPEIIDLVELDRLRSFSESVEQKTEKNPFLDPFFPALIVATHVHINSCNENSICLLPTLYKQEKSSFLKFNRSTSYAGIEVPSVRDEFLRKTMGDTYLLKGLLETPPGSLDEYVDLMNRSRHAFPNDKFFPVRDVSYIRPSRYGTFEFRAACSTKSINRIIQMVQWRILQLLKSMEITKNGLEENQAAKVAEVASLRCQFFTEVVPLTSFDESNAFVLTKVGSSG